MKIVPLNPLRTTAPAKRTDRSGGGSGDFARALEETEEGSETVRTQAAAPVSGIDALLVIQEVGDPTTGRRKARARGAALLDRLDDLRLGLLTGSLPQQQLDQLRELIDSERAQTDDPHLNEVLDEIDLRVQVELAKLSRD